MSNRRGVFGSSRSGDNMPKQIVVKTQKANRLSAKLESGTSASKMIEWDDVRCRPIYSRVATTDLMHYDKDTHASSSLDSEPEPSLSKTPAASKNGSTPGIFSSQRRPCKGKRKMFHSKQCLITPENDDEAVAPSSKRRCTSTKIFASQETTITMSSQASNVTTDDSSSTTTSINNALENDSQTSGAVFNFDTAANQSAPPPGPNNANKGAARLLSSRSSIETARRYFAQLDASTLNLQVHHSGRKNKAAMIVRTRRRTRGTTAEYTAYCQVCRDTRIVPLSLDQFLAERDTFLQHARLYDGILD